MPFAWSSRRTGGTKASTTKQRGAPKESGRLHREALDAARQAIVAMRANDEIGDDAFRETEEELDWLEMAGRSKRG